MPALNASLQVASLVEASGVPYVEKLAKAAVAVIELLEVCVLSLALQLFCLTLFRR